MWDQGDAYVRFMGRWSGLVAAAFLDLLPPAPSASWLDVGCGTGDLIGRVARSQNPGRTMGVDPSVEFLAIARQRWRETGTEWVVGSAEALPIDDGTFDRVVSGLALNFVPDVDAGLRESRRVTAPGGHTAAYVWDHGYADFFLTRFWSAAEAVLGRPADLDERGRWELCSESGMRAALERAGIDAEVHAIDVTTTFADADELWDGFLLGVGPGGTLTTTLDATTRAAVRRQLEADLPAPVDQPQPLTARAWAFVAAA